MLPYTFSWVDSRSYYGRIYYEANIKDPPMDWEELVNGPDSNIQPSNSPKTKN